MCKGNFTHSLSALKELQSSLDIFQAEWLDISDIGNKLSFIEKRLSLSQNLTMLLDFNTMHQSSEHQFSTQRLSLHEDWIDSSTLLTGNISNATINLGDSNNLLQIVIIEVPGVEGVVYLSDTMSFQSLLKRFSVVDDVISAHLLHKCDTFFSGSSGDNLKAEHLFGDLDSE